MPSPNVAVITGAASGIGAETARLLSERGWALVLCDLNADAGAALAKSLGADFVACDHTDPEACRAVVEQARQSHGRLNLLFANAGVGWTGTPDDCAPDDLRAVMETNVIGPWTMIRAALTILRDTARAEDGGPVSIVLTASALAVRPREGCMAYTVSKSAVIGLGRSLSRDLGPDGIRVNVVAPGLVRTPASEAFTRDWALGDDLFDRYAKDAPLGRIATTRDIAEVTAFLASDAGRGLSASTLVVDCGTVGH